MERNANKAMCFECDNCKCDKDSPEFQKVAEFKQVGLDVYIHNTRSSYVQTHHATASVPNASKKDTFILHNTSNAKVKSADFVSEFDINNIKCLRCQYLAKNIQKMLKGVQVVDKQAIRGVCNHCMAKLRSSRPCYDCQGIAKRFSHSLDWKQRLEQFNDRKQRLDELAASIGTLQQRDERTAGDRIPKSDASTIDKKYDHDKLFSASKKQGLDKLPTDTYKRFSFDIRPRQEDELITFGHKRQGESYIPGTAGRQVFASSTDIKQTKKIAPGSGIRQDLDELFMDTTHKKTFGKFIPGTSKTKDQDESGAGILKTRVDKTFKPGIRQDQDELAIDTYKRQFPRFLPDTDHRQDIDEFDTGTYRKQHLDKFLTGEKKEYGKYVASVGMQTDRDEFSARTGTKKNIYTEKLKPVTSLSDWPIKDKTIATRIWSEVDLGRKVQLPTAKPERDVEPMFLPRKKHKPLSKDVVDTLSAREEPVVLVSKKTSPRKVTRIPRTESHGLQVYESEGFSLINIKKRRPVKQDAVKFKVVPDYFQSDKSQHVLKPKLKVAPILSKSSSSEATDRRHLTTRSFVRKQIDLKIKERKWNVMESKTHVKKSKSLRDTVDLEEKTSLQEIKSRGIIKLGKKSTHVLTSKKSIIDAKHPQAVKSVKSVFRYEFYKKSRRNLARHVSSSELIEDIKEKISTKTKEKVDHSKYPGKKKGLSKEEEAQLMLLEKKKEREGLSNEEEAQLKSLGAKKVIVGLSKEEEARLMYLEKKKLTEGLSKEEEAELMSLRKKIETEGLSKEEEARLMYLEKKKQREGLSKEEEAELLSSRKKKEKGKETQLMSLEKKKEKGLSEEEEARLMYLEKKKEKEGLSKEEEAELLSLKKKKKGKEAQLMSLEKKKGLSKEEEARLMYLEKKRETEGLSQEEEAELLSLRKKKEKGLRKEKQSLSKEEEAQLIALKKKQETEGLSKKEEAQLKSLGTKKEKADRLKEKGEEEEGDELELEKSKKQKSKKEPQDKTKKEKSVKQKKEEKVKDQKLKSDNIYKVFTKEDLVQKSKILEDEIKTEKLKEDKMKTEKIKDEDLIESKDDETQANRDAEDLETERREREEQQRLMREYLERQEKLQAEQKRKELERMQKILEKQEAEKEAALKQAQLQKEREAMLQKRREKAGQELALEVKPKKKEVKLNLPKQTKKESKTTKESPKKDKDDYDLKALDSYLATVAKEMEAGEKLKKDEEEYARQLRRAVETSFKKVESQPPMKLAYKSISEMLKPGTIQSQELQKAAIISKCDGDYIELPFKSIRLRAVSLDNIIHKLVNIKQGVGTTRDVDIPTAAAILSMIGLQHMEHKKKKHSTCLICSHSDLELELIEVAKEMEELSEPEVILRKKILPRDTAKIPEIKMEDDEGIIPFLFKSKYLSDESPLEFTDTQMEEVSTKTAKPVKEEFFSTKGIMRYALSDRSFIDKGWTMLPTEKVVRKTNVYRMQPARPEFDWFEHNKKKGFMRYDGGQKLAEFDEDGRGRWYYRNGRLALNYYNATELNAQQRYVVHSSGEPDARGRSQPLTILATFDYLGNGVVFDHSGKIRLKYNQTEGVVLDRGLGPVTHWKWHSLNDPPELRQVMIDTKVKYKDPEIMKMEKDNNEDKQSDQEDDMLAIEFENYVKERSNTEGKVQSFKPFQIKMKALKINKYFSLRIMDQTNIFLMYKDGSTNMKLNLGMILDHREVIDTNIDEVEDIAACSIIRFPAKTDSVAQLQLSIANAQKLDRVRTRHEQWVRPQRAVESTDQLVAATSRPLRPPLQTHGCPTNCPCRRRTLTNNLYYDTRLV